MRHFNPIPVTKSFHQLFSTMAIKLQEKIKGIFFTALIGATWSKFRLNSSFGTNGLTPHITPLHQQPGPDFIICNLKSPLGDLGANGAT